MQPSLIQLAESCRGGARERSVTLAPRFSFTPPLALPLMFCRQKLCCQFVPPLPGTL